MPFCDSCFGADLFVSVGAFFYWRGRNVLLDGDYLLCFCRGGERYCGAVDECHSVVMNVLKTC
jgi:hypothetical protein